MANVVIFADGAELNSTELWNEVNSATVVAALAGMSGAYCFELGSNGYLKRDLLANKTELWFSFRVSSGTANFYWTVYDSDGTQIFTLVRNSSSGLMEARLGGTSGTLQATGTKVINLDTVYLFEIHFKPLNSGGDFEFKIDSNALLDIDFSGDTTNGLENCRQFRLSNVTGATSVKFDDVVVDEGDWNGNLRIAAIVKPNGAGSSTQWDPSAGANYQCVDEIPPSDSDYNGTNVTNEIDMFAHNNVSGTIATIRAVQFNARMCYEGAPTPTHVQIGYRSGGSNYFSGDIAPPVSFGQKIWVQMTDQATGLPFTESGINATEIGYKATA